MKMSRTNKLLALARSDPGAALEQITAALDSGEVTDRAELSELFRAAGLAARSSGRLDLSRQYVERAISAAVAAGDSDRATEARMTLAANNFHVGRWKQALAQMRQLRSDEPDLQARIAFQIGTMQARMGRTPTALENFDIALTTFVNTDNKRMIAVTRKNRGMLLLLLGDYRSAIRQTEEAKSTFAALGIDLEVSHCTHNLALIESHSGNLPRSFELFEQAEQGLRAVGTTNWAKASHCTALLVAGLASEALALAEHSEKELEYSAFLLDKAETVAVRAEAELALGRFEQAARTAEIAASMYRAQGRHPFAAAAELTAIKALPSKKASRTARRLADELDAAGMRDAADRARLAGAALSVRPSTRIDALNEVAPRLRRAPFDLRMRYLASLAGAHFEAGTSGAAAVAARGARLLESFQALVGLSDARATLESTVAELHEVGLAAAVGSSNNTRIFDWIERSAISTSLVRRPEPVDDPALREALTELSAIDAVSRSRRRELEREVRVLARTKAPRVAPDRSEARTVRAALGVRVIASYAIASGRLYALRSTAKQTRRFDLGRADEIISMVREVRRALALQSTGSASLPGGIIEELDTRLLAPMNVGGATMIVVPPPALAAAPWPALPSRGGAPTVVARSASGWLSADNAVTNRTGTVAVDGPGLDHAQTESRRVTRVTDRGRRLPNASSLEQTLEAIETAGILHVASHGHLRTDNPLFSSLQLHGGDLYGYHLLRLRKAPTVVVLSACHLGLGSGPAGRALLGFTDAFLSAGTSSVIASTLPVPDTSVTVDLMVDLHTRMAAGERPATALANAQASLPEDIRPLYSAAFTCFGAG